MRATFIAIALLSASVAAQPSKAPTGSPNICDQSFSSVTEDADHNIVVFQPPTTIFAVPWVDVQDNHNKQVTVLSELSKQQNKGGPYTVTVSETMTCDSGPTVRVSSGSIYVEGVTLDGLNKVAREILKQADLIVKRYEDRARQGAQTGWNHKNAQKVARDESGQVLPPGQAKKQ